MHLFHGYSGNSKCNSALLFDARARVIEEARYPAVSNCKCVTDSATATLTLLIELRAKISEAATAQTAHCNQCN